MTYRWFAVVPFAIISGVQSFTGTHCLSYLSSRQATCQSNFPLQFAKSSEANLDGGPSTTSKKVELWLDLRGTAILPTAAIEFLRDNLAEDDEDSPSSEIEIDRILVAGNKVQAYQEISHEDFIQPDLLYVSNYDDSTLYSTKDGRTEAFGEMVFMDGPTGVENPLKVMQTLSAGNWIVLTRRGDESEAENSMIHTVGDFLEIASNSVSSSWDVAPTGLLVHQSQETDRETNGAGVAIKCSSPNFVMQLASTIEFAGSGMTTTMLDSGILIQDDITDASDLPLALLLPFDVPIWRVANSLYGNGTD